MFHSLNSGQIINSTNHSFLTKLFPGYFNSQLKIIALRTNIAKCQLFLFRFPLYGNQFWRFLTPSLISFKTPRHPKGNFYTSFSLLSADKHKRCSITYIHTAVEEGQSVHFSWYFMLLLSSALEILIFLSQPFVLLALKRGENLHALTKEVAKQKQILNVTQ